MHIMKNTYINSHHEILFAMHISEHIQIHIYSTQIQTNKSQIHVFGKQTEDPTYTNQAKTYLIDKEDTSKLPLHSHNFFAK